MFAILVTVAPVFLLIAVGYGAVRLDYLKGELTDTLNIFAVRVAVPALLFQAMGRLDLAQAFSPPLLVSYYAGAYACFAIAIVLARTVFRRRPGESVAVGFAATFSNSVLLGIPIIDRAYGAETVTVAFGIIALHAPLIYATGMITMELMRRDGRPLGETLRAALRSILANPLMAGILAGLAVNAGDVTLPEPLDAAIAMLAAAAIPAALVGIGASLTRYKMTAALPETLTVSALSLVVHPLIALVLSHYVFGLSSIAVHAAVVIAAMPPGVNIYIFASLYDRAVGLAASALLLATVLAVGTVTVWLYVVDTLAPL
ncbi:MULTISPECIES: AEC family transporter [unclassified Roseitalea]|uniref:AEC family transporter n=1 Tax=unclassified Roseitalea TaxID=2639107 RepID=UPI00273E5D9E|nr:MULTISPECIES: AEC family transporter [unclassified Roseitalea]